MLIGKNILALYETSALSKLKAKKSLYLPTAIATTWFVCKVILGYWRSVKNKSKMKNGIPMPTEDYYPIVGHLLSFKDEPDTIRKFSKWHNELGPVIRLQMGNQTLISVDSPQLAHKIFAVNGSKSSGRPHSIYQHENYSRHGLGIPFAQNDAGWRKAKAAVTAALSPEKINEQQDSIRHETLLFVDRILNKIDSGKREICPYKHVQMIYVNNILDFSCGIRYGSLEDEEYKLIVSMIEQNNEFEDPKYELPAMLPFLYYFDYYFGAQREMREWVKRKEVVVDSLIEKACGNENENFIKSMYENKFDPLEKKAVAALLSDIIGAGVDTTATTVLWFIRHMCNFPEVQSKAAAEIENFISLNGRLPTFNEREQLPYCVCLMKESIRFSPTTPFGIPHRITQDVEIDGYYFLKDTNIVSNMRSMHRQASIFSDPDQFIPERYMNNLKTIHASARGKVEDRDLYNFGWGRRACPAPYFAEMESFIALTSLLSKCVIEPASDEYPDLKADKRSHFKAKFSRRTPANLL